MALGKTNPVLKVSRESVTSDVDFVQYITQWQIQDFPLWKHAKMKEVGPICGGGVPVTPPLTHQCMGQPKCHCDPNSKLQFFGTSPRMSDSCLPSASVADPEICPRGPDDL